MGAYSSAREVLNNIVLELPASKNGYPSFYEPTRAHAILRTIVEVWDPDWATWATVPLRSAQAAPPRSPVVGWLTYLRGRVDVEGAECVSLGSGTLVRVTRSFADVEDTDVIGIRHRLQSNGAI